MVVDDSLTIRRVTERLLTRQNYTVVTAKDGLDAMAQLQTETPLAILLDIEMPRADGRSEEHTSELQSLMRISYAVFCLKKKKRNIMRITENYEDHAYETTLIISI